MAAVNAMALVPRHEPVTGWGMAVGGPSEVVRPDSQDAVRQTLLWAAAHGYQVALRGTGCSYGDASCGVSGQGKKKLVVDLSGLKQIKVWQPQTGLIRAEAGLTIAELWQHVVADGWWPPVVSGTMAPTLGGAVAMNIHGKNAYAVGPIGQHVRGLRILTVAGQVRDITPQSDPELFHAVISSAGELAVILEVELQLKRIYSGRMRIYAESAHNLSDMFAIFAQHEQTSDYLVGWMDAFATGSMRGRGLIHVGWQLKDGEDLGGKQLLAPDAQTLPPRLFGVIPKSQMWRLMKPFTNRWGMRLVNLGKFWSSRLLEHKKTYLQTHGAFHFLLDYVPGWKKVYEPGGLIQHQIFVPKERAQEVFAQVLSLQQRLGMETYLAVMKRHKPDPFLLTHGLDGYSLAQDFAVTATNRRQLWDLCHQMDQLVTAAGGRFYFAKDATLQPQTVRDALGDAALRQFAQLRSAYDPDGVLATDLYDRALGPALALAKPIV